METKTIVGWNTVYQFLTCLMNYIIVHPNLGIISMYL